MGYKYLNGQNWQDITREERFFCLELYIEIKKDEKKFVKWLYNNVDWQTETILAPFNKETLLEDSLNWEVGYEVCFYRDVIHSIYKDRKTDLKSVKNPDGIFSPKRTFDLCLFSEKHIIIIEAKAHEGFLNSQIKEFQKDFELTKDLLQYKPDNIGLIALYGKKPPSKQTSKNFHGLFNWKQMYELYGNTTFEKLTQKNAE